MTARLARGAAVLAAAITLTIVTAAPASAHNYLVDSTPAADSAVTELPDTFTVTTNEALLDIAGDGSGFAMEVTDAAGQYYGTGCLTIAGAVLAMGATLGEPGAYTMVWQVVSADGHPISDTLAFEWAPTDTSQVSEGSATAPVCESDADAPAEEPAPGDDAASNETPAPDASTPETTNAALSDVLWIGGAIAAIVIAAVVTLIVLGRRKK